MASLAKRADGRWRARYRDEADKEHSRHFARKLDAQRWLDEVTTSVVTGQYVDPKAGRVTFATFYTEWAARQVWEATTVLAMDLAASSVPFAQLPLAELRRSHVEQWVKQMSTRGLAPGTVRTRVNNVRAVLRAAVRDRLIASDPSDAVTLPRLRRAEAAMALPTNEQVAAVLDYADERFRVIVALAAFAGLRLGEAAGLQVADVDYCGGCSWCAVRVQRAPRRRRTGAAAQVRQ
jgi:integrase